MRGNVYERLLIGVSMVPRGEVGLIFASVGKALGVLPAEMFSVIVMVIIFTTFVAPPCISIFSKKLISLQDNVTVKPKARFL